VSSDLVGSLFSVEQGRDLLEGKRTVLAQSLDDGEVEVDEFEEQPDTVHNVVFPVESVHGDGVDVLVLTVSGWAIARERWTYKDQRHVDTDLQDEETLGSNSEGQAKRSARVERTRRYSHLDGVRDKMGRKGNVVESVVEEDHGQDDSTSSRVSTHWITVGVESG